MDCAKVVCGIHKPMSHTQLQTCWFRIARSGFESASLASEIMSDVGGNLLDR